MAVLVLLTGLIVQMVLPRDTAYEDDELYCKTAYPYRAASPIHYVLASDYHAIPSPDTATTRYRDVRFDRWCIMLDLLRDHRPLYLAARHAYYTPTAARAAARRDAQITKQQERDVHDAIPQYGAMVSVLPREGACGIDD